MAKNAVTDWDTTAANNTDVAGINISGSGNLSQADDAMRAIDMVLRELADAVLQGKSAQQETREGVEGAEDQRPRSRRVSLSQAAGLSPQTPVAPTAPVAPVAPASPEAPSV